MPTVAERLGVAVFLLAAFLLQLRTAFHLDALQAFDQYNLFFEADCIDYVSAVANGWSFTRSIHPGFALFVNVPIRAVDALATALGIIPAAAIRNASATALAPLCGLVGSVFLWLACVRARLSAPARIGAVVLLQGSFSQVVFTAIPESYAVSGVLFCLLLWAAALGAARPALLDRPAVKAAWLLLCVVMTGVTVSNGIFCIGVWLALRAGAIAWRRWLLEGLIGAAAMVICVPALQLVDRWVYTLPAVGMSKSVGEIGDYAVTSDFVPSSVPGRIVELPAHAVASIFAPPVERRAKHKDRYPFEFSFIESAVTAPRLLLAWVLVLGGLMAGLPRRLGTSALARAAAVVFALNIILHSVWGREVFLYSQHWLAFLVFALAAGIDRSGRIGGWLVLALGLLIGVHSVWRFTAMIATLSGS